MKYFVKYVEDSTNKYKEFSSEKDLNKFVAYFLLKNQDKYEHGYWVELVGKGELAFVDPTLNI